MTFEYMDDKQSILV